MTDENVLEFDEFSDVMDDMKALDNAITDEVYELVEGFAIIEDEVSQTYTLVLYDSNDKVVVEVKYLEDYDTIIAYLEEEFDLDLSDYDPDDDELGEGETEPWGSEE